MQSAFHYDFGEEYLPLRQFAQTQPPISYKEFDRRLMEQLNLFVVPRDELFLSLEDTLERIIRALPSFKRIFTKPITRLTDTDNILPIEAVRVINQHSMAHISRHSEHWGEIEDGELKPRKLMTLERKEDYAIYENIAFVRLIDMILSFTRKNIRMLKDIMYAHRDLHFNLLECTHHIHYFLALGKLHIGYMHAQEQDHLAYDRCLQKLLLIERTLREKLHAPVYRHCKKKQGKIKLKKTNVFRLHKDYQQVYGLLKWFGDARQSDELEPIAHRIPEGYSDYCAMLSVFAAGHFNFQFGGEPFRFSELRASAVMADWHLELERIRTEEVEGLLLSLYKDKTYRICLIWGEEDDYTEEQLTAFWTAYEAEEYWFASSQCFGEPGTVYLSLFDVESFRRIQQLLLRGMVNSDTRRDVCPFCGDPLHETAEGYVCGKCRTVIRIETCEKTGETYPVTSLLNYKIKKQNDEQSRQDKFLVEKYAEARLFYRNITPLSLGGEFLCPKCGKAHSH
ncbi:MAG: hypothetical protein IJW44_02120 [Clostridia bacterium]|nr:hypothetical protein [Clostridia bacterium]